MDQERKVPVNGKPINAQHLLKPSEVKFPASGTSGLRQAWSGLAHDFVVELAHVSVDAVISAIVALGARVLHVKPSAESDTDDADSDDDGWASEASMDAAASSEE